MAEQERLPQSGKSSKVFENDQIVGLGLAETDPWIKDNAAAINALAPQPGETLAEKFHDLSHYILIQWLDLHISRCPLHVHDDNRYRACTHQIDHGRIMSQGRDIIDHISTGGNGLTRDLRLAGINRDG